jgi:hypothetical protein
MHVGSLQSCWAASVSSDACAVHVGFLESGHKQVLARLRAHMHYFLASLYFRLQLVRGDRYNMANH